eukprot:scaffold3250_cov57-Phaeocystis_antarctica.AAC.1
MPRAVLSFTYIKGVDGKPSSVSLTGGRRLVVVCVVVTRADDYEFGWCAQEGRRIVVDGLQDRPLLSPLSLVSAVAG